VTGRTPRPFVVFGFETTHDALVAEEILRAGELDAVPIPTPRVLGSHCGIALRVPFLQAEAARLALAGAGLEGVSEAAIEDV
jgi:hypothetical protein